MLRGSFDLAAEDVLPEFDAMSDYRSHIEMRRIRAAIGSVRQTWNILASARKHRKTQSGSYMAPENEDALRKLRSQQCFMWFTLLGVIALSVALWFMNQSRLQAIQDKVNAESMLTEVTNKLSISSSEVVSLRTANEKLGKEKNNAENARDEAIMDKTKAVMQYEGAEKAREAAVNETVTKQMELDKVNSSLLELRKSGLLEIAKTPELVTTALKNLSTEEREVVAKDPIRSASLFRLSLVCTDPVSPRIWWFSVPQDKMQALATASATPAAPNKTPPTSSLGPYAKTLYEAINSIVADSHLSSAVGAGSDVKPRIDLITVGRTPASKPARTGAVDTKTMTPDALFNKITPTTLPIKNAYDSSLFKMYPRSLEQEVQENRSPPAPQPEEGGLVIGLVIQKP